MSVRRKNTLPSVGARPSAISIYSATLDLNDEDDHPRYCSAIYFEKVDIYHILERQEGKRTLIYHLFIFCLTLIPLVFGAISTIDEWRPTLNTPLYYVELGLCIFFTYELLFRIWSAGCLVQYRTWFGRLIFITRPVIVLDILTLLGFALCLATGLTTEKFPEIAFKFLPPLQMIRFLRVDRQLSSWIILKDIILKHRQELTVTVVIGFMFLITGAYLVYIAEVPIDANANTGLFKSMADAIWFAIISVIFFL
jgi:potassium voltage-gated channel KQT-like subfamily protein 1